MSLHPLAGKPAPIDTLVDLKKLEQAFYENKPNVEDPTQKVSFGTSGHRGSSNNSSFTESHILAITQAICDYRMKENINGPLYIGRDTHLLSGPAERAALEVLAANQVQTLYAADQHPTPTPVISFSILAWNRTNSKSQADGIVITPSHNPPEDGGFKYNPPHGGPADTAITDWIEKRANELLAEGNRRVKRQSTTVGSESSLRPYDFITPYVSALPEVLNMSLIQQSGLNIGADPLGGASVEYWVRIAEQYRLKLTVVNKQIDPSFRFMPLDHDGKIRMDCSSPYAMTQLMELRNNFDIAFGNDPDSDRHGIVTRSKGLLNPNHYLAACIHYLFTHRPQWSADLAVGKTLVSSAVIDRVASLIHRQVLEVPVGFKWFVPGLHSGALGFGGEESAGASFLTINGKPWSTDKDGIILNLLACEMTAALNKDPGALFTELSAKVGLPFYQRIDRPISPEKKKLFKNLTGEKVLISTLGDQPILQKLTRAPGNNAPIGGLKITTQDGWFAARPSGTENIYKIYAESFKSETHLACILNEAEKIVDSACSS